MDSLKLDQNFRECNMCIFGGEGSIVPIILQMLAPNVLDNISALF